MTRSPPVTWMPEASVWSPDRVMMPLPDFTRAEAPEIAPERVPEPVTEPPPNTRALPRVWPESERAPPESVTEPVPSASSSPTARVPLDTVVPPE